MKPQRGFTLIEVVVALAITGVLMVVLRSSLGAMIDAAARVETAAQELDRDMTRRLWLTRAFGSALSGAIPARGFSGVSIDGEGGEADRVTFVSIDQFRALPVAIEIGLSAGQLLAVLELETGSGGVRDTLVLADSVRSFGAEYLMDYGAAQRWFREWISPSSAPVAVRFRIALPTRIDTLLLHVGARG